MNTSVTIFSEAQPSWRQRLAKWWEIQRASQHEAWRNSVIGSLTSSDTVEEAEAEMDTWEARVEKEHAAKTKKLFDDFEAIHKAKEESARAWEKETQRRLEWERHGKNLAWLKDRERQSSTYNQMDE